MNNHKTKTLNKTIPLYNTATWYSYTFKKFYCSMSHGTGYNEYDIMESFKTQDDFISHMKECHCIDVDKVILPPEPHDSCYIVD
jgi:hypothetical protein